MLLCGVNNVDGNNQSIMRSAGRARRVNEAKLQADYRECVIALMCQTQIKFIDTANGLNSMLRNARNSVGCGADDKAQPN